MKYQVKSNIPNIDENYISAIDPNLIEFTTKPEYFITRSTALSQLQVESSYQGYIYKIGNRYRFAKGGGDIQLLEQIDSALDKEHVIAVFVVKSKQVIACEYDYDQLFGLALTDEYYRFKNGKWQLHCARFNPSFELYAAFRDFKKSQLGYMHIDVLDEYKEQAKAILCTINGVEIELNPKRHFPISNINLKTMDIQFQEPYQKMLKITKTADLSLTANDLNLYERMGINYDPRTQLWTSVVNNNSDKLLVIFPGFGGEKYNYPVSTFKAIDTYNKLIFADVYGNKGSYLSVDNDGEDLYERVINKIEQVCRQFSIKIENITFIGVSKGASAAIHFGKAFENAKIHAICPQLDIEYFTRNFLLMNQFLKNSQRKYEVDYNLKNVHLYVAENDKPSHQNRFFETYECKLTILRRYNHIKGGYHAATKAISLLRDDCEIINGHNQRYDLASNGSLFEIKAEILYAEIYFPQMKTSLTLNVENNSFVLPVRMRNGCKCDEEQLRKTKAQIMYITKDQKRFVIDNIQIGAFYNKEL